MKLADGSYNPPFASGARLTLDNGAYTYVGKDRTTLSFVADGNLSTWRNAAGATLTLAYTGSPAKLTAVTNDFRRQLTFTSAGDLLTQVQDDSGRSVSFLYDTSSNLIGAVDPLGNQASYAYDLPGRMTTIVQPSFPATPFITNRYDSLDRVMTQSYGDGGTWQYFFAGARSEEVNPYGMRRVLYNTPRGKTRPQGQLDRRQQQHHGLHLRRLRPVGHGQLSRHGRSIPLQPATTETFTYDNDGNIVERTSRAGEKSTFDYDGLNRLTMKSVFGGQTISYSYDLAGRLTSVGDNSAAIVPAVSPTGSTVTAQDEVFVGPSTKVSDCEWRSQPCDAGECHYCHQER